MVRRGWRHAITNHRLLAVACIDALHRGPTTAGGGQTGPDVLLFPRQPDGNIRRVEVLSDSRWELMC